MPGRRVAVVFHRELSLLERHVGRHVVLRVGPCQFEGRGVEGVPTGEGDELEPVAQGTELLLELGNRVVVQVAFPVERRRAVVSQHLVGELGMDGLGELPGLVQVGGTGLAPDQIAMGRVGKPPADRCLHAGRRVEKALRGPLPGQELLVPIVDVAGDEGGAECVGAGHHDRRDAEHISGQASCGEGADVLLGGDENLAAHVSTLLLRRQLILEVHPCRAGPQHTLGELVDVERPTKTGLAVSDDRDHPVAHRLTVVLRPFDLVGSPQGVVDPFYDHRY